MFSMKCSVKNRSGVNVAVIPICTITKMLREKSKLYLFIIFVLFPTSSQRWKYWDQILKMYSTCGNHTQLGDFSNQHLYNQEVFLCYKFPCRLFLGQDTLLPDVFHLPMEVPSWEREDHGHRLEKETQQQSILEDDRCGRSRRREDDDLRTRGRQDHEDNQPNIIT